MNVLFRVSWHNLLERLDDLPEGATFRTPLSNERLQITGVQDHRVIIRFTHSGESVWRRDEENGQATADVNYDASAPELLIIAGPLSYVTPAFVSPLA